MSRLKQKVAIITGAASGIGQKIAEVFARHGAKVVIADINDEKGKAVVSQIVNQGFEAAFLHTDVTRSESVENLMGFTVEKFGGLHILVNNAAVFRDDTTITKLTEDVWDKVLEGTLKSVFLCTKSAIPEMVKSRGGSIINISSVNATYGVGLSAYTAAKGGVVALSKLVATEYGDQKIRSNAILPGTIETEASLKIWMNVPEAFESVKKMYPLGRIGIPEDVAYCALYLASDEAAFVTGGEFIVDGGLTAGRKFGF